MTKSTSTPTPETKQRIITVNDHVDIVEMPSGLGGIVHACGKCSSPLEIGNFEENVRDEMAKEIEDKIIQPFALLAGVFASVKEENEADPPGWSKALHSVGDLLGLMIHGARHELKVQQAGGSFAYWLEQFVKQGE